MNAFAANDNPLSPYRRFSAEEWGALRDDTPLPLSDEEIIALRGRGETISRAEAEQIYLPLARLLSLYVEATQGLFAATGNFLGRKAGEKKVPFIIGVGGSVAVGKSTVSRILCALLSRRDNHPKVQLVTTDGFLLTNKMLEERGLMERKGWPESFDLTALKKFLTAVKSGEANLRVPLYSHIKYDVTNETAVIDRPDILIVEGLNVLRPARMQKEGREIPFVSDFFDFSIYLDADTAHIREWYIARFLELRQTAFAAPDAYFSRYKDLDDEAARKTAHDIWTRINQSNLENNILPTRGRADLILRKNKTHRIDEVLLRKI